MQLLCWLEGRLQKNDARPTVKHKSIAEKRTTRVPGTILYVGFSLKTTVAFFLSPTVYCSIPIRSNKTLHQALRFIQQPGFGPGKQPPPHPVELPICPLLLTYYFNPIPHSIFPPPTTYYFTSYCHHPTHATLLSSRRSRNMHRTEIVEKFRISFNCVNANRT